MTSKSWKQAWEKAHKDAERSLSGLKSPEQLEALRLKSLGRKGSLTVLLKKLKDFSLEERRGLGGLANRQKEDLSARIEALRRDFGKRGWQEKIEKTDIDATLPGSSAAAGRVHPLTLVMEEMARVLGRLGFSWAEGPLIETDYYNFEALNIPADHPARDSFDTFYLMENGKPSESILLRTHTSPVQIRKMKSSKPPLRIISPGRVFRHEAVDASHAAVFHQVEGLYVDRGVTMADLKGTVRVFLESLFGPRTRTRFRPSYYPFTEPSADAEVQCIFCAGAGCGVCKRSGWLEVLGSGMVHSNVFKAVGYDPEEWSGFAFGMGVERFAMLMLGIPDIRMFYQNDLRFLEQFK